MEDSVNPSQVWKKILHSWKIGDRVRIHLKGTILFDEKWNQKYEGKEGTILRIYSSAKTKYCYEVSLDNGRGCLACEEEELEFIG